MLFKGIALLKCSRCDKVRDFQIEADIVSVNLQDAKVLTADWDKTQIVLDSLELKGVCFNCLYDKAA